MTEEGRLALPESPAGRTVSAQALSDLGWWRVAELPRVEAVETAREADFDPSREERTAVIMAAYHAIAASAEGAIAACWARPEVGAPLDLLVGGVLPGLGAAPETHLAYPPGAVGQPFGADRWDRLASTFERWARLRLRPDPLSRDPEAGRKPRRGPSLEDGFFRIWRGPFAWLVVAEPVARSSVASLSERLDREIRALRFTAEGSELSALQAQRLEERMAEFERSASVGLWRIHVLLGARSEPELRAVGALAVSAQDLFDLPCVLLPPGDAGSLARALASEEGDPLLEGSPGLADSAVAAALVRPPSRELPGIRAVTPPDFDVTSESSGPLRLGVVMTRELVPCGDLTVSTDTLNRHAFVCGATGFGKSQTIRTLLEQLTAVGTPWLVIEPAKAEYRAMAARLPGHPVVAIRPGEPGGPAVSLNPLEPASLVRPDGSVATFALQTHADLIKALFVASFESIEPFPQILAAALTRCYLDLGWDLALGTSALTGRDLQGRQALPRYPRLGDLQRTARRIVDEAGYGSEVRDNVRGLVEVRLGSLRLGSSGRFFEGGHPLDMAGLMRRDVVLELEGIGDDRDKAFFIGAVIIRLVEHLRLGGLDLGRGLAHVTVIEEAHRLLRRTDERTVAHAVEMFGALLAEVRAYGEGIVVAEQIPSKIIPDVIKNTALKVVHRLPAQDDRDAVGATMNLTHQQSLYVVTLDRGSAAVFAEDMDRPVLARIDNRGQAREADACTVADPPVLPGGQSPCGRQCVRSRPCTLAHLAASRRVAADPELTLWVELTVAAHVAGDQAPQVTPEALARLRDLDAERTTVDCALGQLCVAAVESRYRPLAADYQPEELAAHVARAMEAQLWEAAAPCGREVEWWVRPWRWRDVFEVLQGLPPESELPIDDAWRARGLRLSPGTANAAWDQVVRQSRSRFREREALHGADTPSAIERVAGLLSGAPVGTRLADAWRHLGSLSAAQVERLHLGGD